MSKLKYAMVKGTSGFIRDWDPMTNKFTFTDDIDRALLYTVSGIEEHLPFFERHDIEIVPVEVIRVVSGVRQQSSDLLDKVLAKFEDELKILNKKSGNDVDNLSEKDFRRWKRLKRMIEDRIVDKSAIEQG